MFIIHLKMEKFRKTKLLSPYNTYVLYVNKNMARALFTLQWNMSSAFRLYFENQSWNYGWPLELPFKDFVNIKNGGVKFEKKNLDHARLMSTRNQIIWMKNKPKYIFKNCTCSFYCLLYAHCITFIWNL